MPIKNINKLSTKLQASELNKQVKLMLALLEEEKRHEAGAHMLINNYTYSCRDHEGGQSQDSGSESFEIGIKAVQALIKNREITQLHGGEEHPRLYIMQEFFKKLAENADALIRQCDKDSERSIALEAIKLTATKITTQLDGDTGKEYEQLYTLAEEIARKAHAARLAQEAATASAKVATETAARRSAAKALIARMSKSDGAGRSRGGERTAPAPRTNGWVGGEKK